MAAYRKVLGDHDTGDGLKAVFNARYPSVRFDLSSQIPGLGQMASDGQILRKGRELNYHVITDDKHYQSAEKYPCDKRQWADRTLVLMPRANMEEMAAAIMTAWRRVSWAKVRTSALLVVHATVAVLHDCGPDGSYVEVARYQL